MPSAIVRLVLVWASFLVVPSGLLLLVLDPGTPEFTITVFTLSIGIILIVAVFGITYLLRRRERHLTGSTR